MLEQIEGIKQVNPLQDFPIMTAAMVAQAPVLTDLEVEANTDDGNSNGGFPPFNGDDGRNGGGGGGGGRNNNEFNNNENGGLPRLPRRTDIIESNSLHSLQKSLEVLTEAQRDLSLIQKKIRRYLSLFKEKHKDLSQSTGILFEGQTILIEELLKELPLKTGEEEYDTYLNIVRSVFEDFEKKKRKDAFIPEFAPRLKEEKQELFETRKKEIWYILETLTDFFSRKNEDKKINELDSCMRLIIIIFYSGDFEAMKYIFDRLNTHYGDIILISDYYKNGDSDFNLYNKVESKARKIFDTIVYTFHSVQIILQNEEAEIISAQKQEIAITPSHILKILYAAGRKFVETTISEVKFNQYSLLAEVENVSKIHGRIVLSNIETSFLKVLFSDSSDEIRKVYNTKLNYDINRTPIENLLKILGKYGVEGYFDQEINVNDSNKCLIQVLSEYGINIIIPTNLTNEGKNIVYAIVFSQDGIVNLTLAKEVGERKYNTFEIYTYHGVFLKRLLVILDKYLEKVVAKTQSN